jgi:hypothetical protein
MSETINAEDVNRQTRQQHTKQRIKHPTEQQDTISFWERVARVTTEEWNTRGFTIYVWRVWPVIDKKDSSHYLCKVSEPIDPDYILRHFGSGKYLLQLNGEVDGERGKRVDSTVLSIHNPDFAPKLDPAELVASDPRNEVYFNTWGKKPEEAKGEGIGKATGDGTAEILRIALEATGKSEVDPKLLELFQQATKQRDELASKLAELGKGDNASNVVTVAEKLVSLLDKGRGNAEQWQVLERLLMLMEKSKPAPEPDPLATFDRALEVFAKLQRLNPGARSASSEEEGSGVLKTITALLSAVATSGCGRARAANPNRAFSAA